MAKSNASGNNGGFDTSASLLLRLRHQPDDQAAWQPVRRPLRPTDLELVPGLAITGCRRSRTDTDCVGEVARQAEKVRLRTLAEFPGLAAQAHMAHPGLSR